MSNEEKLKTRIIELEEHIEFLCRLLMACEEHRDKALQQAEAASNG